uniref:Proteasome-activating nucleotidase n=1 Tax=Coccidioides posadasii RMSCC 3488 TaxID=454284 RepID=A0A0J6FNX3_COCPO|nr:proteasome-activating nucleotidase [Coccidioides posadasii RMSCC 3488]
MQCARLSLRHAKQSRFHVVSSGPCPRFVRGFRTSKSLTTSSGGSPGPPTPATSEDSSKNDIESNQEAESHRDATAQKITKAEQCTEDTKSTLRRDRSPYGSAVRRSMRNRRLAERSTRRAVIPTWFRERNIVLSEQTAEVLQHPPHTVGIGRSNHDAEDAVQRVATGGDGNNGGSNSNPGDSPPEYRYMISEEVWNEIRTVIQAGMAVPSPRYADDPSILLNFMRRGARGGFPLESDGFTRVMKVYHPTKKGSQREADEEMEEAEDEIEDENESTDRRRSATIPISRISDPTMLGSSILQGLFGGRGSVGVAKLNRQPPAAEESSEKGESEQQNLGTKYEDLVIQIQDYKDLLNTTAGSVFLSSFHKAVQARRRKGQKVVVVGTVSASETDNSSGKSLSKLIPRDYDRYSTTIFVTPAMDSKSAENIFAEDEKRRTLEINIRHLQSMLKTRLNGSTPPESSIFSNRAWALESSTIRTCGLDAEYWPFDLVHRIATLALGSVKATEELGLGHIEQAIQVFEKSDQVKCAWMGDYRGKLKPVKQTREKPRFNKSKLKCNSHEEKLLNGVVDAESIRTSFKDVHVPQETIEALKTLTSLSLVRPDAFTYGVLATDKIPGLLLYGPPGTGKTLLAKAVARESGATVLEVSGSEVYDMYVGEGEKNVKAIFTLAKKLSPCVVFIDEADAIFCSRTGASNRTSHRELINQFLREWDGMSETSAFIMVATNRPFDLDDAVLRRLPRRLLVDLPTEKDRHEILKIHLKDEAVDKSVDLTDLARRTPFYSGSDLKNMSVAAALACVREEYDAAIRHKGDEPYKYPERRILKSHHFDRAMEEISASISEDMSSLTAIRKFDEKYGDRKGRRKKSAGWGFTPPGAPEPTLETGRVRH